MLVKSRWSRALAVTLAVVMCFTMTTSMGFAASGGQNGGQGSGLNGGQDQSGEGGVVNLVTIGSSLSNGYCMPDYYRKGGILSLGFSTMNNYLDEESLEAANATRPQGTEEISLGAWAEKQWKGDDPAAKAEWIQKYGNGPWTVEAATDWFKNNRKGEQTFGQGIMSKSAYPWQLKKYIMGEEGVKNVNLTPINLNGMRTDELRALLDDEYYQEASGREFRNAQRYLDETMITTTEGKSIHKYEPVVIEGKTQVDEKGNVIYWVNNSSGEHDGTTTIEPLRGFLNDHLTDRGVETFCNSGAIEEPTMPQLQEYVQDSLKNADVIVVDLCTNNFGTYLGDRLKAVLGMGLIGAPNTLETMADVNGLPADLGKKITGIVDSYTKDVPALNSPMVKQMLDTYLYSTADCIVNYKAEMEWISKNKKKDAIVITVGLHNSMKGLVMKVGDQSIDLGAVTGAIYELVDTYIRTIDKSAAECYYAPVSDDNETFISSIINTKDMEELLADESFSGSKYALETLADSMMEDFGIEQMLPSQELRPLAMQVLEETLYKAVHDKTVDGKTVLDMGAMQAKAANMNNVMKDIGTYVQADMAYKAGQIQEEPVLDPIYYDMLHMFARYILGNAMGEHPNKVGCDQKFESVKGAYLKGENGGNTAYEDYKAEIAALLGQIKSLLDGTPVGEDLDEAIDKINMAYQLLDLIDQSGLTKEDLEDMMALKDQLADALDVILDTLDLTMDDLYKAAMQATEPENVQKVAEQLKQIRSIIDRIPKTEEEAKEELLRQLDNIDKILEENALGISEELLAQLKDINAALKQAVTDGDYSAVAEKLAPIGQKLLAIAEAVAGLPEYEEAMAEYMQANEATIAGLTDRVNALDELETKLLAKSVRVDLKTEVSFPDHTCSIKLTWKADADADGYLVTRDGENLACTEEEGIMTCVDPDRQVGTPCTYKVTPYINDKNNNVIKGSTYIFPVTPQVDLAKAKTTNFKKGKTSFKVSWKAVKGADGYQVSYKTGKKARTKTVSAEKLSVTVKNLKANKKYTVKVRAYQTVSGNSYFGKWSKSKSFKTKK